MARQISALNPTLVDVHEYETEKQKNYDIAFLCLPTDPNEDGSCNTLIVEKAIEEINAKLIVIRSTVTPGFTRNMKEKHKKRLVFQPENWGTTQHSDTNQDYIILGGDKEDTHVVAQLYIKVMNAYTKILQVDSTTAELSKYMHNAHLAMKVALSSQFYHIAKSCGVDYIDARELMLLDKRISPSHTFISDDQPFYDSHCLNKDVPALIHFAESLDVNTELLSAIDSYNTTVRNNHG
jgi:nucleotide sugar dehydrogenase